MKTNKTIFKRFILMATLTGGIICFNGMFSLINALAEAPPPKKDMCCVFVQQTPQAMTVTCTGAGSVCSNARDCI